MVMDFIIGMMVVNIMVNGKKVKCMVMEYTFIEMGLYMMDSIKMIRKMGLVIINGLMDANM
jgi:hypothetical protein